MTQDWTEACSWVLASTNASRQDTASCGFSDFHVRAFIYCKDKGILSASLVLILVSLQLSKVGCLFPLLLVLCPFKLWSSSLKGLATSYFSRSFFHLDISFWVPSCSATDVAKALPPAGLPRSLGVVLCTSPQQLLRLVFHFCRPPAYPCPCFSGWYPFFPDLFPRSRGS